jgi:hypothetical protein
MRFFLGPARDTRIHGRLGGGQGGELGVEPVAHVCDARLRRFCFSAR